MRWLILVLVVALSGCVSVTGPASGPAVTRTPPATPGMADFKRFRAVVGVGCLISLAAPMLKGSFLPLLVLMLALGLCGTPLIIFFLLVQLNRRKVAGEHKNGWFLNVMGTITLVISTFLAVRFILAKLGLIA